MEDILASIKRIIADDTDVVARQRAFEADDEDDEEDDRNSGVLELTQPIDREELAPMSPPPTTASAPPPPAAPAIEPVEPIKPAVAPPAAEPRAPDAPKAPPPAPQPIVSDMTVSASRQSLAALSALLVKPEDGESNTLEGLVREMLRPMLKEWLDQKLPGVVERLVEAEIRRLTGRAL
jgi:cell pole-organizing protein PopZ